MSRRMTGQRGWLWSGKRSGAKRVLNAVLPTSADKTTREITAYIILACRWLVRLVLLVFRRVESPLQHPPDLRDSRGLELVASSFQSDDGLADGGLQLFDSPFLHSEQERNHELGRPFRRKGVGGLRLPLT